MMGVRRGVVGFGWHEEGTHEERFVCDGVAVVVGVVVGVGKGVAAVGKSCRVVAAVGADSGAGVGVVRGAEGVMLMHCAVLLGRLSPAGHECPVCLNVCVYCICLCL